MIWRIRSGWTLSLAAHGAGLAALVAVAVPGGVAGVASNGAAPIAWVGASEEEPDAEEILERPTLPDAEAAPVPPLPGILEPTEEPAEDAPAGPPDQRERAPSLAALLRASPFSLQACRPRPPRTAVPAAATANAPRLVAGSPPAYPAAAAASGAAGHVLLRIRVSADGRVAEVTVQESSGWRALDEAAVAAARDWIFEPARAGGVPVEAWVEAPIRFVIP
ncbi:MAG: TonB family protein [Planctomycetales bacterium]|nr:TonB family protein [Planctomycetales bacterium]